MRVPAFRWTLCWLGVCGAILSSLVLTRGPTDVAPARPVARSVPATVASSVADADAAPATTDVPAPVTAPAGFSPAPVGCRVVTYTPPTATSPQQGQLCEPADPLGVAMILVHGGGGTGGTRSDTDLWAVEYRRRGITTFAIDYRLVDPAVDAGVWPVPEQHVKAAAQFLRTRAGELGLTSIQVHGFSAGARLAGVALTTPDDPAFEGADHWDGVSDAVDGAVLFYGYYNDFVYEPDAYWGDSPIPVEAQPEQMAAGASAPALLVHGDIDFLVPAAESVGFAAALRVAGNEQTLWIVGDQPDHGFDGYGTGVLSDAGQDLVGPTIAWVLQTADAA